MRAFSRIIILNRGRDDIYSEAVTNSGSHTFISLWDSTWDRFTHSVCVCVCVKCVSLDECCVFSWNNWATFAINWCLCLAFKETLVFNILLYSFSHLSHFDSETVHPFETGLIRLLGFMIYLYLFSFHEDQIGFSARSVFSWEVTHSTACPVFV